jgi:hypothetical protein
VIPLTFKDDPDPAYPHLPIPRLLVSGLFEPSVGPPDMRTYFGQAFVDTGSPYAIIPYRLHHGSPIKIYSHLGLQPYRTVGTAGPPLLQPLAEVAVRFLVTHPVHGWRPPQFVRVKAYLLEQNVRPGRVVIGLDSILKCFPLFAGAGGSFFLEPGEPLPVP